MRNPWLTTVGTITSAALAVGLLAACGSNADAQDGKPATKPAATATKPGGADSGTPGASTQALPPIMADPADADGNSYTVPMDNNLVFLGLTAVSPTVWQGKAETPGIVEFVPGKDGSDGTFNPGWKPLKPGTTKVTMSAPGGTTYTFTITVVPAS